MIPALCCGVFTNIFRSFFSMNGNNFHLYITHLAYNFVLCEKSYLLTSKDFFTHCVMGPTSKNVGFWTTETSCPYFFFNQTLELNCKMLSVLPAVLTFGSLPAWGFCQSIVGMIVWSKARFWTIELLGHEWTNNLSMKLKTLSHFSKLQSFLGRSV